MLVYLLCRHLEEERLNPAVGHGVRLISLSAFAL
jgi:hypothetical protein